MGEVGGMEWQNIEEDPPWSPFIEEGEAP